MILPINISPDNIGYVSQFAPRPLSREELSERVNKLPPKLMMEIGAKLYLLMNLTWGYVDTILDLCREMRLSETKKLAREIKELKRGYDQFRSSSMGDLETAQEEEMGVWFEEIFSKDFKKLFASIDMESGRIAESKEQKILYVSVHQCLTLIEAVKVYARFCDGRIKEHGAWTCDYCMVQTEFLKMHTIIKKYPSAMDPRFVPLREVSAKILANRLHQTDVGTENGKIWLKVNNPNKAL